MSGRLCLGAYRRQTRLRDRLFTLLCRTAFRRVGRRTLLELPLRVWGERRIEIGTDVFIGANCWFHVVEDTQTDQSTAINIGDGTSIAGGCTVTAARRVIIERHVLMARNVYVSDHSHAYSDHDRPIKDQGVTKIAPVRICEGAWLGQNVVVCPGVTIGRNAVVGANSVVRDDVPDFCVAVGAPARVIRRSDALLVGPSTASAHSSR